MNKQAIIIGATGLVGRYLLQELTATYQRVFVIARRPPEQITANLDFYQLNDFANIDQVLDDINKQVTHQTIDAFSCLGTTKKQAGSKVGFRQVDYAYNLAFASKCQQMGVSQFYLLSAMGADANSWFFYNKVKGELETAIQQLGFEGYYVFQPSLLLGEHKGRPLESLSQKAFQLVSPLLSESLLGHPISAQRVAQAMILTAQQATDLSDTSRQCHIIDNKSMLAMTSNQNN